MKKQLLKLIAEGYKKDDIADMLYMSVNSVMVHRTNIRGKPYIHSRTELVKFAIRKNLIELKPQELSCIGTSTRRGLWLILEA